MPYFTTALSSLIGKALQNWGSDESQQAIDALRMQGSPEMLATIQKLANGKNWRKRALAIQVACQLRRRDARAPLKSVEYAVAQTQTLLLAGLTDRHSEVVCAAIYGLGHRPHPAALGALLGFASHTDPDIRLGLAFVLSRYDEPESVEALIRLARDTSSDVRNWATFALGTQLGTDSVEVRNTLWNNLHDSDEDVQGEALVGLAARKDDRIIPILFESLNANCRVYELNAAQRLASPLLRERLEAIRATVGLEAEPRIMNSYWFDSLIDAIEACQAPLPTLNSPRKITVAGR